ncbi:TPA: HNH endonuclease, partial [Pasteurella multocida]|nr:HNH endonuclease [Pasteurella multocida]HDR1536376.1 HNH endonuclease [Pasteurella multocida]
HKEFRFTFRGSVEHYYPQNPLDGIPSLDKKVLDNFGNLCLVSREKNAKLSNHTPEAKKDYYLKSGKYDSLKQKRMMESSSWGKNYILAHSAEMIKILNQKTPYSTVS